jgi:acetoacetyl-CoA reductase
VLLASDLAFVCHCSRSDLAASGGIHHRCVARQPRPDPAVRFRVPRGSIVHFDDGLRGPQQQDVHAEVGDFVLRRADGCWAYQLAVVVDDAAQGVTEVVRGADLLDSTARQILLQQALGLAVPRYWHLPLLLDAPGHKLSKSLAALPVDSTRPLPVLRQLWQLLGQAPAALAPAHDLDALLAAARQASTRRGCRGPTSCCRPAHFPRRCCRIPLPHLIPGQHSMTSRVALVTGGTGGIGTAICQRLADQGHRVATNYRDEAKARAWQQAMTERGYHVAIFPGDVSDPDSAEALVRAVEAELGPVEILVNNAGITRDTTFHRMRADQWHDVINTNLNSVFNVTRPVIEGMRRRGWGRVIQISSINGLKGQYGQANYAAAKAGMHGFTISLARERRLRHHRQHHFARLRRHRHGDGGAGGSARQDRRRHPDRAPRQAGGNRLRVSFLVAEEAAWITGSNLDINGGHHMGW